MVDGKHLERSERWNGIITGHEYEMESWSSDVLTEGRDTGWYGSCVVCQTIMYFWFCSEVVSPGFMDVR